VKRRTNAPHPRTPLAESLERIADARPLLGESVEHRAVGMQAAHDAIGFEASQPLGQQIAGDAWQSVAQFMEPRRTAEQLAEDEDRPAVAHEVERCRHRAHLLVALAVGLGPCRAHHGSTLP